MSRSILITGGTRSGKSALAESLAASFSPPLAYVATAEAGDGEMRERIARHRARRDGRWQTLEEPLLLPRLLEESDGKSGLFLVDCITLWITNLYFHHREKREPVLDAVRELTRLLPRLATPVIMVTNETGMGIVPDNPLARSFRDLAGETNQLLAAAADEVHLCVSGLPLRLKG